MSSTFLIQCDATKPDVNGERVVCPTKYFGIDKQSGGYPWFPEQFAHANFFQTYDIAKEVIDRIVDEKPSVFNNGPTPDFSSHTLPDCLRNVGGGRFDADGSYAFVFQIIEIEGRALSASQIKIRYRLEITAEQFSKKPNTPPVISYVGLAL